MVYRSPCTTSSKRYRKPSRLLWQFQERSQLFWDWLLFCWLEHPLWLVLQRKGVLPKAYLCYIWWQLSVLLSAGARRITFACWSSYCYWMCYDQKCYILNIGPSRQGFLKAQVGPSNSKWCIETHWNNVWLQNIPLGRQCECTLFFMAALDFKHWNLSHTKLSV